MKLALSLLKNLPAELAHSLALNGLKFLDKLGLISLFVKEIKNNELELSGMKFKNNLGTAAGLDKNGDYINSLGKLGFGFLEVGTVTPLPQSGNENQDYLEFLMKMQLLIGWASTIKVLTIW